MDGLLTNFLQYDYAEGRTIATTLLTASGGLLAGSLVFTEKFIGLRTADLRLWKQARLGLYAFAAAGFCSGGALIGNYATMVKVLRRYGGGVPDKGVFAADVAAQNQSMAILFIGVGVLMIIGLLCLLNAADVRHRLKQDADAGSMASVVQPGVAELPEAVKSADSIQSQTS